MSAMDGPGSPWQPVTEPVPFGGPAHSSLVLHGSTFCLSGVAGDIRQGTPHGFFVADRRMLSRLELRVHGELLDPLGVHDGRSDALFVGRPQQPDPARFVVVRRRTVAATSLVEDVDLQSHAAERTTARIGLLVAADFLDLFAVKERRTGMLGTFTVECGDVRLAFEWRAAGRTRTTLVEVHGLGPAVVTTDGFTWDLSLEPGEAARLVTRVTTSLDRDRRSARPMATPSATDRPPRLPEVVTVHAGDRTLERVAATALEDLESLRIRDPHGGDEVVGAGAPWFMTLFGRDALWTSIMMLPYAPLLSLAGAQALARLQGRREDPETEEAPGRILHELRFGTAGSTRLADAEPYFGTVDATPLFVVLVGELVRWGAVDDDGLRALVPHVDAAMEWIRTTCERDPAGYLSYRRSSAQGLENQGWKDSWDGIRYGDGSVATAPLALAEVQAYVYAALRARARIATGLGEEGGSWVAEAERLRERFDRDFWMADHGLYAVALDGAGRQVDSVASNSGHVLWSGIALPERTERLAGRIVEPDLWSGWGIRTLSAHNPGFDPLSYHCGSVWPHDTAIAVMGLCRAGHHDAARLVAHGLASAAEEFRHHLPELLAGLSRSDCPVPVRYPTSCMPQAWAAAGVLALVSALLGLSADASSRSITVRPALGGWPGRLEVDGIMVSGARLRVRADNDGVHVEGLPVGWTVRHRPG
jgi:glycogen debranching enzyme